MKKDLTHCYCNVELSKIRDKIEQEKAKEIIEFIEEFKNPYPKDIFVWKNKEKLDFDRGRLNEFIWNILENTKRNMVDELEEKHLGKKAKGER